MTWKDKFPKENRYFETDLGILYQGDCLEIMKKFPDKSVDLIFTSPPYNTGNENLGYQPNSTVGQSFYGDNYSDNLPEKEYKEWIKKIIKLSISISRYVFWNMMLMSTTKKVIVEIQNDFINNLKDIHFWHKQAVCSIQKGVCAKGVEWILCFGEDNLFQFKYNNFPKNNYIKNINTFYKKDFIKSHHATFPKELVAHYVKYFSRVGDLTLDPFIGSGTTAIACEKLGRRWIGIEISEKYCGMSKRRIKAEADQKKLFF